MYELRLFALEQLSGMSADLFLCDPHRIIVSGPTKLRGRPLDSRDLRSGMALIAAALAADGESRVAPLETVERGYGALVERLQRARRAGRARNGSIRRSVHRSVTARLLRRSDRHRRSRQGRLGSGCGCSGCGNRRCGGARARATGDGRHRRGRRLDAGSVRPA